VGSARPVKCKFGSIAEHFSTVDQNGANCSDVRGLAGRSVQLELCESLVMSAASWGHPLKGGAMRLMCLTTLRLWSILRTSIRPLEIVNDEI
jgi:hypothetical protein